MRGQAYSDEIKERAYALYSCGTSISKIAGELQVPRTTVKGWLDAAKKKEEEHPDKFLTDARAQNKQRFVDDAWRIIHDANVILQRRFERARKQEDELDRLLTEILMGADELSRDQINMLIKKFSALRLEDVGRIAVVLGTLYDKTALIAKEVPTDPTDCMKFEDF